MDYTKSEVASPGIVVLPPGTAKRRVFCILGVARGGTSMVAGMLKIAGIFMGDETDKDNNEDLEFTAHRGDRGIFVDPKRLSEKMGYIQAIRKLVVQRTANFSQWGWKDPLSSYYVEDIIDLIPEVEFIIVVRDVAAVAMREMLEGDFISPRIVVDQMNTALNEYGTICHLQTKYRRPTIILSYERCLRHPGDAADVVYRFLRGNDLEGLQHYVKRVMNYITPDRLTGDVDVELPKTAQEPISSGQKLAVSVFGDWGAYAASVNAEASDAASFQKLLEPEKTLVRSPPASNEPAERLQAWAEKMYELAARFALDGNHAMARFVSQNAIIGLFSRFTKLGLGPTVVHYSILQNLDWVKAVPGEVFGFYSIIGMELMLTSQPGKALNYFSAGFAGFRQRLLFRENDILARALIWHMAFHCAYAAKAVGNEFMVTDMGRELKIHSELIGGDDRFNQESALRFLNRFSAELKGGSTAGTYRS